ncbi:FBD-associated F-box protein At5g56370-like [Vicia villosa]|uniref:FBD-associated F-box protein At5g56370-like n=1 Tax=Vicia villosa TaxID=3911 RepID=UPI00273B0EA2|nr:FBD-associated F-box protein At5g56370-like [Vicia villosa]
MIPVEDRLSALPDSILCHILSFLPTKHSAATSILSKRWNSLWLSVFTLDFVVNNLSDTETFDRVILLRDIKVPIQTLRVKRNVMVKPPEYPNSINPLIMVAIERGLETLELDMVRASNIFSCKTLTVIKLKNVRIVRNPPPINISPLKTLHLDNVRFVGDTDIITFLLNFPTLEELQTCYVVVEEFTPETAINKCLPNLKRATISYTDVIPLFMLSRALILSIKLHTWSQKIPTFHSLTQLELFLELDSKKKWKWMLDMLHQSPKLQHILISEDNWQNPDAVPKCFQSQLKTLLFRNYRGRKCELQFAEYVMRNSKLLRTLTIRSSCSMDSEAKSEVLKKLSLCPRSCDLIFD